jgi:peptide/nickel transport system substrate-binding protein
LRRTHVTLAALSVAALALSACGGDEPGGSNASGGGDATGGDLVIVRPADSTDMNNTMVHDNDSIWVFQQMLESLYQVTPDGKDVEPLLVESDELSEDQKTLTIKLKDGITFSDGKEMTSEDVKFSIDTASSTEGGWEFLNVAIDSVEAPDPSTVVVTTKYPWAPLKADLANFNNAIVPKDYGGKSVEEFYEAPIGTGPFKWDHWDRGSELQLVKNADYWDGAPALDSVTWKVVGDDNARTLQLQGGQAHINQSPPFSSIEQLEGQEGIEVELFESTKTDYIMMNQNEAPYDDVHVRRAISYAIDREAIIETVLFGNGEPGNSLLMPTVPFYDPEAPGQQYDMEKAKAELAQSSVPDGFTTTFLASSGDVADAGIAQILQSSLKELGITMEIQNLDPSAAQEAQQTLDYQISHSYWTMDIADPDELVSFAVDPEAGAESFFTGYNNPEVVENARAAAKTFDEDERARLYAEVQRQAAEDAFLPTLFYSPFSYSFSSGVEGFQVYPTGNYHLEDVTLSE